MRLFRSFWIRRYFLDKSCTNEDRYRSFAAVKVTSSSNLSFNFVGLILDISIMSNMLPVYLIGTHSSFES